MQKPVQAEKCNWGLGVQDRIRARPLRQRSIGTSRGKLRRAAPHSNYLISVGASDAEVRVLHSVRKVDCIREAVVFVVSTVNDAGEVVAVVVGHGGRCECVADVSHDGAEGGRDVFRWARRLLPECAPLLRQGRAEGAVLLTMRFITVMRVVMRVVAVSMSFIMVLEVIAVEL